MNTETWIRHFETNTQLNDALPLPQESCRLPDAIRIPLAKSLATFQLGETGGGSRLRRYARTVAPMENFRGYQRAIDLFIAEELSHSRLLARVLSHLGGELIEKQWTNWAFRRMRGLLNLEFAIQVLLTAELIAEVYFGTLYLRADDGVVRTMAHKILRDEMKHLAFQREFLAERVAAFSPLGRWLWRVQFQFIHAVTSAVVAWDHRHCLRALKVKPADFRRRAVQSWRRFQDRLEGLISSSCPSAPDPRLSPDHTHHSASAPGLPPHAARRSAVP